MLLGLFWGVFGDFWARNRHLFSFFGVASLLREGVGVLEITPHLLNVTGQASTPLGVDSLDPLVRPSISIAIVPLYDLFNVAD